MTGEIMQHPLAIAAVIGVFVSLLKNWKVPKKFYTLIAISLGLFYYVMFSVQYGSCTLITAVMNGLVAGGTASGIYSGIKGFSNGSKTVDAVLNPLSFNRDNNNPLSKPEGGSHG